ncbi:ABC transporter ATP-binding protein [Glycomyces tenuis]|uniref:ABC transporter ATP-binding protein n=1 Tax=Glycomyces tenuis TaxID=58116 RepID=UPI0004025EBE|nr:ABC transporter ATP-binding protein [Glycomyces tenuis]
MSADTVTAEQLTISEVTKVYDHRSGTKALDDVSLTIRLGELVVLLGPSGCGKTTLLRILAGLEDATSGRLSLYGEPVVDTGRNLSVPPHKRGLGMVFQNYALWPHMKVVDNVAYPLRTSGLGRTEARERALEMLRSVRCDHLATRLPSQLSGGQQQRIALGRALVARPGIVLFDEPLSNVDAQLRKEVRTEIRRLHAEIDFTGIYVTHDLQEGLELADRIVVMSHGRIEQIGTPEEIFTSPISAYVAEFMGIENKTGVRRRGGVVATGFGEIEATGDLAGLPEGVDHDFYFRASQVRVAADGDSTAASSRSGGWTVADMVYAGGHSDIVLTRGEARLLCEGTFEPSARLEVGAEVDIEIDTAAALLYPSGGDER